MSDPLTARSANNDYISFINSCLLREAYSSFGTALINDLEAVGEEKSYTARQIIVKQGKPFWKTYIVLAMSK